MAFTVQVTGTKPLAYQWQWKPAKEDGSEEDGSKENGSEEDGSEEDGNEEDGNEEDGSKENGSEEDGSKEDGNEEDGNEEDGSKDGNEEDGSEEWQPCPSEWSNGATLTIPCVLMFNAGSYRCVINNCVGTMISNPAQLSVGKDKRSPIVRNNTCTHVLTCPQQFAVPQRSKHGDCG